jgi:hypothetical protein
MPAIDASADLYAQFAHIGKAVGSARRVVGAAER